MEKQRILAFLLNRAWWLLFALLSWLTLPSLASSSAATVVPLSVFLAKANSVFQGQGDAFEQYVEIHRAYEHLSVADRRQAGQVLSMVDAMFGRYHDASVHYAESFPRANIQAPCAPATFHPEDAAASIARVAGDARLLMINESHSNVGTRASVLTMLPSLRQAGFRYIALEALTPGDEPNALRDGKLQGRGYAVDGRDAGFYLQEPVYAEVVRSAIVQGFQLVAYESSALENDKREAQQAEHVAAWLRANPTERLVLVGGYSHIWKTGGWMAERIGSMLGIHSVSLDQVEMLGRCTAERGGEVATTVWIGPHGRVWSAHPERVDATAVVTGSDIRGATNTWLTLGESRTPVRIVRDWCDGHVPCLIEARRAKEGDSVPADRWVRFAASEPTTLYLAPGAYLFSVRWRGGHRQALGSVGADGKLNGGPDS